MSKPTKQQLADTALPAEILDVALLDAKACAAVGSVSVSLWHREVAAGRAPAPALRETRCTRWRLTDVRNYWLERTQGAPVAG